MLIGALSWESVWSEIFCLNVCGELYCWYRKFQIATGSFIGLLAGELEPVPGHQLVLILERLMASYQRWRVPEFVRLDSA